MEVSEAEKKSVEKMKIAVIQAPSRSQRTLFVLPDGDNNVFLEGHKHLPPAAADVEPVFAFLTAGARRPDSLARLSESEQHSVGIHADARLFRLHRLLKFRRKRVNSRTQQTLL